METRFFIPVLQGVLAVVVQKNHGVKVGVPVAPRDVQRDNRHNGLGKREHRLEHFIRAGRFQPGAPWKLRLLNGPGGLCKPFDCLGRAPYPSKAPQRPSGLLVVALGGVQHVPFFGDGQPEDPLFTLRRQDENQSEGGSS